ncbi:hypothetical protein LCGC14_1451430 [marine sediment metagenome]|uniref:Uncharacterized protein n=1 Tax=marine sediment metagenome TaxID=412755 RepID=A0A0F9JIH7_9ZZZZ
MKLRREEGDRKKKEEEEKEKPKSEYTDGFMFCY